MIEGVLKHKLFFAISTLVLFFSFSLNIFGAVTTDEFVNNYKDSEALVTNQINCKGRLFADQMLAQNGQGGSTKFLDSCSEKDLIPYSSQFGLQGKVYTVGYTLISSVAKVNVKAYIAFAELLTALASAVVFALLVVWVRLRVGFVPAVTFGTLVALSPMVVGFSRNLYWALPLLILPFVYVLYFYRQDTSRRGTILFWAVLGFLLYLRYLCGYEYITTITVMVMAAAAYVLYVHGAKLKELGKQVLMIGLVSMLAFVLAIVTHVGALNMSTGSTSASISIIVNRAKERTVNSGQYLEYPYANLRILANDYYRVTNTYFGYEKRMEEHSKVWATLVAFSTYLLLPVVHLPIAFTPSFALYSQSMVVFLGLLVALYVSRKKWATKKSEKQIIALFFGSAVGLAGYASWLIIGYSHSLVHAHINGILMYLPFALFGYMIIGLYIESLVTKFLKKSKK